jgi:hypothetical protein
MIDLKAAYGQRYRVTYDESCSLPGCTREDKLWGARIEGRHGHVYVHGRGTLGAYVRTRRDPTDRLGRLLAVPGARLHQRGDDEASVTSPPEHLEAVAAILQLRRRRQVSDDHRRRLTEAGAGFRFQHGSKSLQRGLDSTLALSDGGLAENVPGAFLEAFP